MAVSKTTSTNGKWFIYEGTYGEVINALDSENIPEHKIRGFAFVSAGTTVAMVRKH
jgi:hypothetical protein